MVFSVHYEWGAARVRPLPDIPKGEAVERYLSVISVHPTDLALDKNLMDQGNICWDKL